ncbi:MAG: hypothetical protein ACYTHK_05820 [Planctomycetota bacterium]
MAHATRLFLIEEPRPKEHCGRDQEKMIGSDISAVWRHLSLRYRLRMSCSLGVASSVGAILEQTTSSGVGCGVSVLGEEGDSSVDSKDGP